MTPALEGDSLGLPFDFDIAIEDAGWSEVMSEPEHICSKAIKAALSVLDTSRHGELSIALVNDASIQRLNREHRGKDKPTNVLSFPNDGPAPLLGDIVLARETLQREATERNLDVLDHVTHLLVHSFFHLQGFVHDNDADALIMETLEIAALASLGIDNPYQIKEHLNS